MGFNPLNADLNPIFQLLALIGARPILHVIRIRVNCIITLVLFHIVSTTTELS
jgi:hypothetical protein